jgi:RNA polymerase sigma-70 factor (ECF subfamily)
MDDAGEAELVARARVDRAAFAPLYLRYFDPIYRYCYRRLGSHEAAADATSLVFARALAALPRYRSGQFAAWLFTIARNVVANSYRAQHPQQPLDETTEIIDTAPSPEDLAIAADERRTLLALLARLPEEQRHVVELRLSGLSGPEIGRVLGRSHGAVKVAQFRATARLRALMTGDQPAEGSDDER